MGGGGRREWLFRRESPGEGPSAEWAALGAWKWEGSVVGKAAEEPKEAKGSVGRKERDLGGDGGG